MKENENNNTDKDNRQCSGNDKYRIDIGQNNIHDDILFLNPDLNNFLDPDIPNDDAHKGRAQNKLRDY